MSEWKTIKAPKMLYLPTGGPDFDNSGQRVEPTDHLEIVPGTLKLKINGVEHVLMRPLDSLIDTHGVIQLAKPAPPIRIHSGGEGRATVAGMGLARNAGQSHWNQKAAEEWEGDAGTHAASFDPTRAPAYATKAARKIANSARGFPIIRESDSFFGRDTSQSPEKPLPPKKQTVVDEFFEEFKTSLTKNDPDTEMREITLSDGSIAHALFSKLTGRQIGTPTRNYQAIFDPDGRQLGQAVSYAGPNSQFDMEEYRRRLAVQIKDACIAPTGLERHEQSLQCIKDTQPDPAPVPTQQAVTTGYEHLNDLIGGKHKRCMGWPLGRVSHLYGPMHLTSMFSSTTPAKSIAEAFGRIHLMAAQGGQLVMVQLEGVTPTTNLRLSIAEELPVLDHMLKNEQVAVVIVTPDWEIDILPALLRFTPALRIKVEPHKRDDRFITATVTKAMVSDSLNQTASFPR